MNIVTIVAYTIAIAIPAFTVYLFVALDIFGTGKPSTMLICVGWGAIIAFQLARILNNASVDLGLVNDDLVPRLTAPILEEILKSLILIYLIRHPSFRYIVDGAVYGIAVGIGFGLSENLFIYLPNSGDAVLGSAIGRTLSTALMHAGASGLVGISLGRLRRATEARRLVLPVSGIGLAIALHIGYNNIVDQVSGMTMLLVGVGIGFGSAIVIAWQIGQGLADEKKRFAETLGLEVGVSTGERKAVQQLGGTSIEQIFGELGDFFGHQHIAMIRRLLVLQANVGILQNNLKSPASDRLRRAWEDEIAGLRAEIERVRKQLGTTVNLFLQSVFPTTDEAMQHALEEEFARFDPTMVHTFDMFMRVSELAETFSADQLVGMAERLSQIDIFKHISLANLENLSRAISVQTFDEGQMLFDQGDEGNAMYLIEEGSVNIYAKDHSGQEKMLRTFEPGDVVGEFSLLDGQPRSARGEAAGRLRALVLQREVFMMFIQSRPKVVLAMLQYLADKARYTTQAVETSVHWMSRIEQGRYEAALAAVAGASPSIKTPLIGFEPAEISADTAEQVGHVFLRAAAALKEREQSLRTGAGGA
ncbi:MAG: PrsW family intramembrane metalloprotease [Anaerolineae bacterium]|nr:PrsW family intramembrane metalloprotease [Anaerolineae bacterium]